jgi:hypothetical protein
VINGADGAILFTSLNPDGTPFIASTVHVGPGVYTLALTKRRVAPSAAVQVLGGGTGRMSLFGGSVLSLSVSTFNGSNAAADATFDIEVFDN